MGHTPYGYRIEDGKAVVDEIAAEQVKELFSGYLAGLSLKGATKKAGIDCYRFDPPILENICLMFQLSHGCPLFRPPSLLV